MRMTILIVATMLTVGGGMVSASEQSERRASVLRARAAELKMEAEALRDAKGNNPGRSKQLDAQAESLYEQANKIDDIAWPPRE